MGKQVGRGESNIVTVLTYGWCCGFYFEKIFLILLVKLIYFRGCNQVPEMKNREWNQIEEIETGIG